MHRNFNKESKYNINRIQSKKIKWTHSNKKYAMSQLLLITINRIEFTVFVCVGGGGV